MHLLLWLDVIAEHSDERASRLAPEKFNQLRTRVHLAIGARVMLTSNVLWEERTVQTGLMNGARGTVKGFVYAEGASPPALPAYVVVDFPEYGGEAFWADHPKWVPVPPVCSRGKSAKHLERCQLPLRLAWALTIDKAEGQTLARAGLFLQRPCFSHGQLYVAFSRVGSFQRIRVLSLWGPSGKHALLTDEEAAGAGVPAGGIYTRNTASSYKKVPGLADIPFLGWLFKTRSATDSRTELIIFITPRIINRAASRVRVD